MVANAILWAAKVDVPESGIKIDSLDMDKLLVNQDEQPPADFDAAKVAKEFGVTVSNDSNAKDNGASKNKPKLLFSSPVLTSKTPGHQVAAEVDIRGAKDLYLIVMPGLDGFGCDWANWVDPVLVGPNGEKSLLDLSWKRASADWGAVNKNGNADGGPMTVQGKRVSGLGTHASSVVVYELPAGFEKFKVKCALDDGGVGQKNGEATSVRFLFLLEESLRGSTIGARIRPVMSKHEIRKRSSWSGSC